MLIRCGRNRIFGANKQNITLSGTGVVKITARIFYLLYREEGSGFCVDNEPAGTAPLSVAHAGRSSAAGTIMSADAVQAK